MHASMLKLGARNTAMLLSIENPCGPKQRLHRVVPDIRPEVRGVKTKPLCKSLVDHLASRTFHPNCNARIFMVVYANSRHGGMRRR